MMARLEGAGASLVLDAYATYSDFLVTEMSLSSHSGWIQMCCQFITFCCPPLPPRRVHSDF